jgi:hypothetical protein
VGRGGERFEPLPPGSGTMPGQDLGAPELDLTGGAGIEFS